MRFAGGVDLTEAECIAVSLATRAILFRVPSAHFEADRRPVMGVGDLSGDGLDDLVLTRAPVERVRVHQLGDRPRGSICAAEPNSTSTSGATLVAQSPSSYVVQENDIDLRVGGLPVGPGYFLVSTTTATVPQVGGSVGTLCIGGAPFGRYAGNVLNSSRGIFGGFVDMPVDNALIPLSGTPSGTTAALPGDTFYFQYWYRDTLPGGAPPANLSNAIAVTYR